MDDNKQEEVHETEVKQEGPKRVVKESSSSSSTQETRLTLQNGIWLLLGVLQILLSFRFVLKLLGANPKSGFTSFIYSMSDLFTAPFRGIFSTPTAQGDITVAVFEPATIIAMVVYALIAWGIIKLININKSE